MLYLCAIGMFVGVVLILFSLIFATVVSAASLIGLVGLFVMRVSVLATMLVAVLER